MLSSDYQKPFKNNIDVVENNGGTFKIEIVVLNLALASKYIPISMVYASRQYMTKVQVISREASLAYDFLLGTENIKFRKLL